MKIDIFSHILTEKYLSIYRKKAPAIENQIEVLTPPVVDLAIRFRLMNRYPDVLQMLTVANVPLEMFVSPQDAVELARIANDELADLVIKYPDKFFGAVACLPMNDMDAALEEVDRAITKLRLKGVQIYSRIKGEPLDTPKFKPLYEKMSEYDLPIWIHPTTNEKLDNDIGIFSWPFETTSAMLRLVKSGIFAERPNIKFIIHHAGAMVPFFAERIKWVMSLVPQPYPNIHEHFRKFYNDTAVYGNTSALMCAYDYFGADHLLFGTDAPLGPRWGMVEDTIASIERMTIPDADKEKILKKNAVDLFKLAL
ncbi:MAG: amidohydrolase family protein [Thermodesulfobacteriota bacterium]